MHWGKVAMSGSEHTVNGRQYFGELHIVHYNTKYDSIETAVSQPDGLAVCGFFIEVGIGITSLMYLINKQRKIKFLIIKLCYTDQQNYSIVVVVIG